MTPLEQFTKRIKDLREDEWKTQKEIAEYLRITQQQYSLYESGKRMMPMDLIIELAKFYNVDMNYIAGITKYRTPYKK